MDKERRREIIYPKLAYVLNIAKYFPFLMGIKNIGYRKD